jgi:hypothetical protein
LHGFATTARFGTIYAIVSLIFVGWDMKFTDSTLKGQLNSDIDQASKGKMIRFN